MSRDLWHLLRIRLGYPCPFSPTAGDLQVRTELQVFLLPNPILQLGSVASVKTLPVSGGRRTRAWPRWSPHGSRPLASAAHTLRSDEAGKSSTALHRDDTQIHEVLCCFYILHVKLLSRQLCLSKNTRLRPEVPGWPQLLGLRQPLHRARGNLLSTFRLSASNGRFPGRRAVNLLVGGWAGKTTTEPRAAPRHHPSPEASCVSLSFFRGFSQKTSSITPCPSPFSETQAPAAGAGGHGVSC